MLVKSGIAAFYTDSIVVKIQSFVIVQKYTEFYNFINIIRNKKYSPTYTYML